MSWSTINPTKTYASPRRRHSPFREKRTSSETLAAYFRTIDQAGPLLSHSQEIELSKKLHANNEDAKEAQRTLLERNLRLVIAVAKKYRGMGLPFEDLIQEGSIGLLTATQRFDPDKGYRFSTYATWWIRQAVQRAVCEKGRNIRVPVHMRERQSKLARLRQEMVAKTGEQPSTQQLSEALGWSEQKVNDTAAVIADAVSLDAPVAGSHSDEQRGGGGGARLVDLYADPESEREASLEDLIESEGKRVLMGAVGALPERWRTVLILRYGLLGHQSRTLKEIGKELGLTREGVRQIQKRAEKELGEKLCSLGPVDVGEKAVARQEGKAP